MAKVFIGVDPHKLSATIAVVDDHEAVLATGRVTTDKAGYAAMRKHVAAYRERVWAVEGSNGAGRPLAQRLLADGEQSSMSRPSSAREPERSTPGTTARPTPTTHTRSRSSRCAPKTYESSRTRCSSRPCGCWSTDAKS